MHGVSAAQSLAYYPNPYTVSPAYSMLQTPWYMDYGHLIFWFFFFSTFVLVMWLFYIYSSVAHNIESRRPVRETRGFSRAQVGDTLTAVLPLTWSITMLAHASTHSANFDENTTATVFSFSVIAYQWGWNYYFPRDIVEVLTVAPSLVGHKRAVSLSGMDPYATLLAQSRHEYYSRLTGSTQLGAKHGKHTLNQYLLAAFVGSRSTAEHAWLQAGLYPIGNFAGKGTSAVSSLGVEGVASLSQDNQIALLKDFSLVSSGLNLNLFRQRALLRGTLANTTLGRVLRNDEKFSVAPGIPSKLKSGTHVFRAHASATYVGNRLNRVYSHLAAASVLPAEFTQAARQGFFLQGLTKAASGRLSSVPAYQVVRADVRPFLDGKAVVQSANVGSNLWLLRDFLVCADVAQPWRLALSQTLPSPSASLPSSRNDSVIARLAGGTNEAGTSLPSFQRSSISWAIGVASLKSASVEWLVSKSLRGSFAHKRGHLDLSRLHQNFSFSGEDLAVSGGESQKLLSSDVAWLAPNSATELNNFNKGASQGLGSSLLGGLLPKHKVGARVAFSVKPAEAGSDSSAQMLSLGGKFAVSRIGSKGLYPQVGTAPVLSGIVLAELNQLVSSESVLLPFKLHTNRLATRPVLVPGYSRFVSADLRGAGSSLAFSHRESRLSTFLSVRGTPAPLLVNDAYGSKRSGQILAKLLKLTRVNQGLAGSSYLLGDVVRFDVRGQPEWRLDVEAPTQGLSAAWDGVPAETSASTSAFQVFHLPLYWAMIGRFTRFELERFLASEVSPSPQAESAQTPTSAISALWVPFHQIMLGKFIRLELRLFLFEDEPADSGSLGILHQSRPTAALSLVEADRTGTSLLTPIWVSLVSSRRLCFGAFNAAFREFVYAPAYLYVTHVSPTAGTLRAFGAWLEEVCFFIALGFGQVVAPSSVRLSPVTNGFDWSLFFSHQELACGVSEQTLRTLHVNSVPLTWLVLTTLPDWRVDQPVSPVSRLRTFVGLLGVAPVRWVTSLVLLSPNTACASVQGWAPLQGTYDAESGNVRGVSLIPVRSLPSGLFAELCLGAGTLRSRLDSACPLFSKAALFPARDAHWLGGVSDMYPTRAADIASNDPMFLNSKDLRALDRNLGLNATELFDWWSRWSWEVLSANLPWDRLSRSWVARRPAGGMAASENADASRQIELTDLARQRFDKNSVEALLPHLKRYELTPIFSEIALPVLDAGFGCAVYNQAVVLPAPHVDVDAAFMFGTIAPEINTSRRGDHDSRYKVTWGPVVALSSTLSQGATPDTSALSWPKKSGPQVIAAVSPRILQGLPLFGGIDLFMPNAGSSLKSTGLSAQPQPGALFSGMAQAPVSNGLPLHATRKGYVASYCSQLPASGANPLAGLALASTGLVQTAGEARHHSFIFPASWAEVWQLKARAQPSFGGRVATLSESTAYVDLSRLLYGLSEYSATSGLLAWKQNKLISPKSNLLGTERTLLAAALFRESSLQAVASQVSSSTTRVIRAGYTAIQPGVANMRRLRVTQGIYLPADLPIHGIFGSKDVIHSWAIPGLGVKVDCIPGYSSHRRLFFRWRGLFWGQCMEVCGRYHHWMPLLVRVVHRDVFILWCLTYLRLLTSSTLTGTYAFSMENSQLAWEIAANVSLQSRDWETKEALMASVLSL